MMPVTIVIFATAAIFTVIPAFITAIAMIPVAMIAIILAPVGHNITTTQANQYQA